MKSSWLLIAIAAGGLFLGGAPGARADHKRDRHDVRVARDRQHDRDRQAREEARRRENAFRREDARRREEARARHAALRREERRRHRSGSLFNTIREKDRHRR